MSNKVFKEVQLKTKPKILVTLCVLQFDMPGKKIYSPHLMEEDAPCIQSTPNTWAFVLVVIASIFYATTTEVVPYPAADSPAPNPGPSIRNWLHLQ